MTMMIYKYTDPFLLRKFVFYAKGTRQNLSIYSAPSPRFPHFLLFAI